MGGTCSGRSKRRFAWGHLSWLPHGGALKPLVSQLRGSCFTQELRSWILKDDTVSSSASAAWWEHGLQKHARNSLSAGPLEGQTPSRSPRGISVPADCVEMNVEGLVQILVATRRGETSFYKQMPSSYNTTDKLHTSCEASGVPELVTESPVTLVFASPSVWEEGMVERGGLEMAERWYWPSSPFWEDLGMKGTY